MTVQVQHSPVTEAQQMRDRADLLLKRLLKDRADLEDRLAEAGRRDCMKWITGRSALDNAIDATRRMIDAMDRLVSDGEPSPEPPETLVCISLDPAYAPLGR